MMSYGRIARDRRRPVTVRLAAIRVLATDRGHIITEVTWAKGGARVTLVDGAGRSFLVRLNPEKR